MAERIVANRPYYADELGLEEYANILRGVYVGGCVHDGTDFETWKEASAHAHNHRSMPWYGWICIWKPEAVLTNGAHPSSVLLHELAHLLAPEQHHTRAWKVAVTELGAGAEIERCHLKPLRRKS